MDCTHNDASKNSCCCGNVFTELLPSNNRGIHKHAHSFSSHVTENAENDESNNYSIAACIYCNGNVFTEPLPSNNRETRADTRTDGKDLSYVVEMGSGTKIYAYQLY
jgi:hypothetical protein